METTFTRMYSSLSSLRKYLVEFSDAEEPGSSMLVKGVNFFGHAFGSQSVAALTSEAVKASHPGLSICKYTLSDPCTVAAWKSMLLSFLFRFSMASSHSA